MKQVVQEIAAVSPGITAPAWVPVLAQVNLILTAVSLVIAIVGGVFAIWRGVVWYNERKDK